uniref:Strumpellin domain containing protein n=1 Tax=Haemonchus contortus TaxID=6289 RepID=W6N9H6_HAECO
MFGLSTMTSTASESFLTNVREEANCILAEIVRLAGFIPQDFLEPSSSKYKLLILDFSYFTRTAQYEKVIEESEELQDSFYNAYGDLITRFSALFQAFANFLCSLKDYCDQVGNERVGISYLDLMDVDILFHIGMVLMYIENFLPGPVRERIYVAIYRNSDERRNVEFLADFLRMHPTSSEPSYLFDRLKLSESFVEKCLSCCETIHREGTNDFGKLYVDRSTLIKWVFMCLVFKSSTLKNDTIKMRQIVEDFFRDEWVIQLGLGLNVNLLDYWQSYRAALTAITNQVDLNKAKSMASYHFNALGKLSIPQGKISPNDFDAHIRLISQYNSSLRWLILHTSKTTTKKASSYVQAIDIYPQFDAQALVLLLRASNFEMDFFMAYKECLRNKKENIKKFTGAACAVITEMAQLFSQDFGSLNKDRQTKLHDWFLLMKKTLEELDLENRRNGEFVIQVKRRIAQVGEMHDLSRNLALAQHLQRLETQLDCLSALYNVREEDERQAQRYADPSYLWPILDDWTPRIQRRILESSNVNVVRALFFKLSISISTLCDRFSDERKNLIGRAYSYHLERRLRTILQTIPNKLFLVLKTTLCPALQRQWDPILDKSAAREMADFDDNFHLAESTYTISNLSLGVSRMALKKVGVISINPKELLEEGIRRELALELPSLLTLLDKNSSLEDVLRILSLNLHPFQRGFIYMCEHVDVNGHDMWREEVDAILRRTARDLMERGLTPQSSGKAASAVPALTLIFNLMLKHSDPFCSHYMESSMTWRDVKTKKDVLSSKMIDLIEKWIPSIAINSLRTVLNHDIQNGINDMFKLLSTISNSVGSFTFTESFMQSSQYDQLLRQVQGNSMLPRMVAKVGQLLLLLIMLCQSKKQHCQLHAAPLFSVLSACDRFLVSSPDGVPSDVAPLVNLLRDCGLCTPSLALYKAKVTVPPNTVVYLLLTLYVSMSKLNGTRKDSICGRTFIAGLFCLLHQINGVGEFGKTAELFADSIVPGKNSNERQLLLSYSSSVVTFS